MSIEIIYFTLIAVLIIVILSALYGNLRKLPPSKKILINKQTFPSGFLWATGEDAYQHEGGNDNTDWARWEKSTPSPIANGDKCGRCIDFYNRYEQDFQLAKSDYQNAHRIGIEWSRVEPTEGEYNEAAFSHYQSMLQSLKKKGFIVFLNLWHFTLPLWAADQGGFESERVMKRWKAYVKECAIRFSPFVDFWSTMIDAQIYALSGYATGELPPNKTDTSLALFMYKQMIFAHANAYHIIKEFGTQHIDGETLVPKVGQIYFFFDIQSKSFFLDKLVANQMDRLFNWNMLDALFTGKIELNVIGEKAIKEDNPILEKTLDWIGINYYTRQIVSFNPFKKGFIQYSNIKEYPKSDMDWEIYPEGIEHICKEVHRRYPEVPLFIAENGLADSNDSRRAQYILDHLAFVHKLIEEGLPIFGYTYWSLTDNWEWKEGFWPKFGLYEVDLQTLERKPRGSVKLFRFIVQNNRLPTLEELKDFV